MCSASCAADIHLVCFSPLLSFVFFHYFAFLHCLYSLLSIFIHISLFLMLSNFRSCGGFTLETLTTHTEGGSMNGTTGSAKSSYLPIAVCFLIFCYFPSLSSPPLPSPSRFLRLPPPSSLSPVQVINDIVQP